MPPKTYFGNVDLEVRSTSDLSPLRTAFGRNAAQLGSSGIDLRYWMRLELSRKTPRSPADGIRSFCRLIDKLPPVARRLWKNASIREFDIGIYADNIPSTVRWVLKPDVIRDAAKIGAQIKITVYFEKK
jgi:hypothetical protein